MSWNEQDTEGKNPPDLLEIISSMKKKIKDSLKVKNKPSILDDSGEMNPEISHTCSKKERKYFVELFLKCKTCNKVLKKKTITNPYKIAALLVVVSYGASNFIDYAITDNRYPLSVEYEVMEACASSYSKPLSYSGFSSKKKICLCALEDTMNEISYIRFKADEKGFLKAFEENAKGCK